MNNISNTPKKFTLLYVEDEDIIRQNVEGCLKYIFNVIVAKNGHDGFEKFANDNIDLVITDIVMPIKDGISMLEDIKELSPNMPTIVTSAYNTEVIAQLEKLGVTKCLPKPFDIKKLVNYSMEILDNRL
ncbi:MAG: response regulator [Halarcobacter sp.]